MHSQGQGLNVRAARALAKAVRSCVEQLESRQLLTATWAYFDYTPAVSGDVENTAVRITSDNAGSTVTVRGLQGASGQPHNLQLTLGSSVSLVPFDTFGRIEFVGGSGVDGVIIEDRGASPATPWSGFTSMFPTTLNMGAGSDTLTHTTSGNTTLIDDPSNGGGGISTSNIGTAFEGSVSATNQEIIVVMGSVEAQTMDGSGYSGRCELFGRAGNDTLLGGSGRHNLWGGDGADLLLGGDGPTGLAGEDDNTNNLSARKGDTMFGGGGHDILRDVANLDKRLTNTTVTIGTMAIDPATGRKSATVFQSINEIDVLLDQIEEANFQETSGTGGGNNVFNAEGFSGATFFSGRAGNDLLIGGDNTADTVQPFNGLNGNDGNDTVIGSEFNDRLTGDNGNDVVIGNGGDDTIEGGEGSDTLDGGAGTDTTIITSGSTPDTLIIVTPSGASTNVSINGITDVLSAIEVANINVDGGADTGIQMGDIDPNLTFTVTSLEPTVDAGSDTTQANGVFSGTGNFRDIGDPNQSWVATVNYGDGSGVQPLAYDPDPVSSANGPVHLFDFVHTYTATGVYTVTVTVTDGEGLSRTDTRVVSITSVNHAPTITSGDPPAVVEGSTLSHTVVASDPDDDDLTFTLDSGPAGASIDPVTGVLTFTPSDNGTFPVVVRVTDNGTPSMSNTQSFDLVATNANPSVVAGSMVQRIVGQTFNLSGSFSDVGTADTHTVSINWGDSSSSAGSISGSGAITGSHIYTAPGIYTVTITVTDDDGGIGTATQQVKVISALDAIQQIIDEVNTMVGAGLTSGQAAALISGKLQTAISFLTKSEEEKAAAHLELFVEKVDTMDDTAQALLDDLVDRANAIIDLLLA